MQTHGNEEYIKAFIEYGFHPLKRYKCFTRSVLVLACSTINYLHIGQSLFENRKGLAS